MAQTLHAVPQFCHGLISIAEVLPKRTELSPLRLPSARRLVAVLPQPAQCLLLDIKTLFQVGDSLVGGEYSVFGFLASLQCIVPVQLTGVESGLESAAPFLKCRNTVHLIGRFFKFRLGPQQRDLGLRPLLAFVAQLL